MGVKLLNVKPIILAGVFFMAGQPGLSYGAEQMLGNSRKFKEQNPDWNKYEFTRDYLTSLEYLKSNADRYEETRLFAAQQEEDKRLILLRDELIHNNVNLRVARNYLKKYHTQVNNGLMLKVADIFINVCDELIVFNNEERKLLEDFNAARLKGKVDDARLEAFTSDQQRIYAAKKESLKNLLQASLLVAKVLVSNKENYYGEFDRLGITQEQRYKLLEKINHFNEKQYKGDLRTGQSFVEGSVVAIREILENYNYETNDS